MVSPKRGFSPDACDEPEPKRPRTDTNSGTSKEAIEPANSAESHGRVLEDAEVSDTEAFVATTPSLHSQSRLGIQRSIAMVLEHDGFESATPEALESFTQMVETYLESIMTETKRMALSSRREYPVPIDFEKMLKRHNIPVSSLKPHIKHPIPKHQVMPTYTEAITLDGDAFTTLPLLGPELSGQCDKDDKPYIPKAFPDFPSKHTYKFTPQVDTKIRDSKKIREQAARTAQQGEDALRRLVRASKMRKQKEVKSLVERDGQGKERFRLWESTMKRFMGMEGGGEHTHQVEIADHSMIVNGEAIFARREISRLGKRPAPLTNGNVV